MDFRSFADESGCIPYNDKQTEQPSNDFFVTRIQMLVLWGYLSVFCSLLDDSSNNEGKKRTPNSTDLCKKWNNKQQRADGQEQNALLLWVSYAAWHMEHASHTSAGKHKACLKGKGKAPVTLQGATCDWNGVGSVFPHWLLEVQGSSTIYTYRFHKWNIHTYIYTYIYIYIYTHIYTYSLVDFLLI